MIQLCSPELLSDNLHVMCQKFDTNSSRHQCVDEEKDPNQLVMDIVLLLIKRMPGNIGALFILF